MSTVKTAISLDAGLYDQAQKAARALGIPRSRLFAAALEEYLAVRQNRDILERLNAASDAASPTDRSLVAGRKRKHRALVEGTW